MRLINVNTYKLEEFLDYKIPPYAILSHTWGNDAEELTFRDIEEGKVDKPGIGSVKFGGSCRQAKTDGLGYVWIDTCCIDKTNLVELSEAINSMFRWYRRASVCYTYLSDVPGDDDPRKPTSKFYTSRWFGRGWTLQELLAPKSLRFYNSDWGYLGTKGALRTIIGKITGIPHQILLGITKLATTSVAQRMSWAAGRDTKRKEDLAYCLLGIFNVTMPMIYGEGGDQAFLRLQEQIMKTTRDESILAWGFSTKESPISGPFTAGRILAATPSDFANSGRIISRGQSTGAPNSLDISGGSLRLYLSLLPASNGTVIGLLNCGPDNDLQQAVGIPLTQVTSDEYFRPRGCHATLLPTTGPRVSPTLIHIKNDGESKDPEDANRYYWLYDEDDFAAINLELVDVAPRSRWDREGAVIMSTVQSDGAAHRTSVRFRHREEGSLDFVVILEAKQQGARTEAQCCVLTSCRDSSLEELAGKLQHLMRRSPRRNSASNKLLNLRVVLEPIAQQPMFTMKLEALPHPPDTTIDATIELQRSNIMLEFVRVLERWDEFRQISRGRDGHKLEERDGLSPFRLAAEDGYADMVELLLDNGADVAIMNKDRWTPLIAASSKGHVDVVRLLLAVDKVNADAKDTKNGRTPLSWAAANGHEAIVKLLLDTGMVDPESKDNNGWTPLQWASEMGQEAVMRLLIENGAGSQYRQKLQGHNLTIWAVAFSHDSKIVASGSADCTITFWDTVKGKCFRTLNGHDGTIRSMRFSHDSKLLVSGSHDRTVRLWDVTTGQCRQTLQGHRHHIHTVRFSHDSTLIASGSVDQTIRLWSTATGHCRQTINAHDGYVNSLTFSHDSKLLASASTDCTVKIWDTIAGTCQQTLEGHMSRVNSVVFSRDSRLVASGSSDCTVKLWDVTTAQCQRTFHGHEDGIWSIAFSYNSKVIASGSEDGTVRLWDVAKGQCWQTLEHDGNAIWSVAFSPDSKLVASGSDECTVRIWDALIVRS